MFDNKYPYTDFHELNLDWFMGEFKKLVEEWATVQADWTSLHDYVQNYFNNLNVQTEIDNKINAMILNGTFADIVSPFVTAALPALVAGQLPDVVAAQISAVVAAQISAVVADQLPAVAAAAAAQEVGTWLAAHIDPDTGYVIDTSLTVSSAAADAKTVGDILFNVADMSIEGYNPDYSDVSGTTTTLDKYYSMNQATAVSLNGYQYIRLNTITPGDKYYISGTKGGSDARLYYFRNSGGSFVEYAASGDNSYVENFEVTVPVGAINLIVNSQTVQGPALIRTKNYHFSKIVETPMGVETSTDHYSVTSKNGFVNKIVLDGSNNGGFNFDTLQKPAGTGYKTESDDITPVYLLGEIAGENVGYVGANHGYALAYKYTFNNGHNLLDADIGKIYTASNGYKYVLIQLPSSTEAIIGFYDSTLWYRIRPVVITTTFDFGNGTITADSVSNSPVQLYPSVQNMSVMVVENTPDRMMVDESYDIIDIGSGIDAIVTNVGNNSNTSYCTLADPAITVRNLYQFSENGSVTIYQNVKVLKDYIRIAFYGGVQSMAIGGSDYFSIPQTSYKIPSAIPSAGVTIDKSAWDSDNVPPILYMQLNNNIGSATKAFATGVIMDDRAFLLNTRAGTISTSKKMYPYAIQPQSAFDNGKVFNMVTFRVPFIINEYSAQIKFASYFYVYDDIYMIIMASGSVNTSINIPDNAANRKCEIVMTDGIICETKNVIDKIDIMSQSSGSAILKLYK